MSFNYSFKQGESFLENFFKKVFLKKLDKKFYINIIKIMINQIAIINLLLVSLKNRER